MEAFAPNDKADYYSVITSITVNGKNAYSPFAPFAPFLALLLYMHQPPGFVDSRYPNHVCLLQRSSYGLKQAPRSQVAYLLIYVDDIILTTSSPVLLQQIVDSLHKEFDMTDLGALNYFLGISVVRHPTGLLLSQKKYARQLLERAHMVNCNPSRTPVDTDSKLGPDGVLVQDPTLYRSLAGAPGTIELGLQLYDSATTSLVGYTDADWAGYPSTRRSTSSYCVFLGDNLLLWSAKRQHTISRSSAEAEYWGVANGVAETAWIRNLFRELHSPLLTATLVYCDNVSAVYMSANPVQHQRTKHIEIDIHFVRDMVKVGHVRVLHVPSRFQYADIFTKGLPSALFEDFRSSLSVRPPPAPTAGAIVVINDNQGIKLALNTYELKGKFLDDLHNNAFSRTNGKNADYCKMGGDEIKVSDDEYSDLEEY
ncbi:ribonuclease H-like domain-containing protein [Tanacetum coccineum]